MIFEDLAIVRKIITILIGWVTLVIAFLCLLSLLFSRANFYDWSAGLLLLVSLSVILAIPFSRWRKKDVKEVYAASFVLLSFLAGILKIRLFRLDIFYELLSKLSEKAFGIIFLVILLILLFMKFLDFSIKHDLGSRVLLFNVLTLAVIFGGMFLVDRLVTSGADAIISAMLMVSLAILYGQYVIT